MNGNESLDIKRHGINGEELLYKVTAIINAYSQMVEELPFGSHEERVMVGLNHFRHQILDELEQYIFGKKEQSGKDGV